MVWWSSHQNMLCLPLTDLNQVFALYILDTTEELNQIVLLNRKFLELVRKAWIMMIIILMNLHEDKQSTCNMHSCVSHRQRQLLTQNSQPFANWFLTWMYHLLEFVTVLSLFFSMKNSIGCHLVWEVIHLFNVDSYKVTSLFFLFPFQFHDKKSTRKKKIWP